MPNKNPEQKVKEKCLLYLKLWQERGVVIDFDDVSNLGRYFNPYTGHHVMHTKKGKRDLIAWVNVKGNCWTYLIEVKSLVGVWGKEQQEYASKFVNLNSVVYEVVNDAKQINVTIDRLSGYGDLLLEKLPENIG